jgi:microcystin-dependent protein
LTTEVDTKLGATGYNAADVLTKIKTVDGAGSGLDADTVDGLNPTTGWTGASGATGFTPSNIVARDALGNFTAGTITANLTGDVTGSVSGNAGTVTNGVVTSGSYSNPSWITSLAGSKVTSIPNSSLTNSTITINGNGVALGGSVSLFGTDGTWTGEQSFYDNKFVMIDNVDVTKKLNFQLSNIANATTRTLTVPNENGVIATQAYVAAWLPAGVITLWSGASNAIPSGWALCNGSDGTPDLRNRFVVGAGSTYGVSATGGSADATLVSHSHTASSSSSVSDSGHTHSGTLGVGYGGSNRGIAGFEEGRGNPDWVAGSIGAATTGISVSTSTTISSAGSSATNANLPPYYALCYIMKL